jgi:hypothetical protein
MAVQIITDRDEEFLIIRLKGRIAFDEPDFRMADELTAMVRRHAEGGGALLLLDYSETRFAYPSSLELGVLPLLQRDTIGTMRVAACIGGNEHTRRRFSAARIDRWLDCFASESQARAFLRTGKPMTNGAALDHELWASLGPEIGPERCAREACEHLRIAHSLLCTKHHYEMVNGVPYGGEPDV